MDLKGVDNNKQEVIHLPEKVDESLFRDIASDMSDSFITDAEQLETVLDMFGIQSIESLLNIVSNFFLTKVPLKKITIDTVHKINSKKLIAAFIKETGLTRPKFNNEAEREMVKSVFFKLGRLYLHDVLFPELIEANPRLAYSVLNYLKRTITEIAIAEGFNKQIVFTHLMLDEIEIPTPIDITAVQKQIKIGKCNVKEIKIEFIQLNKAELIDIDKIADKLLSEYQVIKKKSTFIAFLNSQGNNIELLEVYSSKIKFLVHLLYRMYNPYNENHGKLIKMSKGKGYLDFAHENIIDESGNVYSRKLRKVSSDINKPGNEEQIKKDVESILKPIYDKQNKILAK